MTDLKSKAKQIQHKATVKTFEVDYGMDVVTDKHPASVWEAEGKTLATGSLSDFEAAGDPQPGQYYVDPDKSPMWESVKKKYDFVKPSLVQFQSFPKKEKFDPFIDAMKQAQITLNVQGFSSDLVEGSDEPDDKGGKGVNLEELGDNSEMASNLNEFSTDFACWKGHAAEAFRDVYVSPMPSYIHHQFGLATVLRWAMEAEQASCKAVRESAHELADKIINALDALEEDSGGTDWPAALTVLAAVATVAGAAASTVTAGVSLAIAAGVASVAASVTTDESKAKDTKVEGATAEEVMTCFINGVGAIRDDYDKNTNRICKGLDGINDAIGVSAKKRTRNIDGKDVKLSNLEYYFQPPKPALADSTEKSITDDLGFSA